MLFVFVGTLAGVMVICFSGKEDCLVENVTATTTNSDVESLAESEKVMIENLAESYKCYETLREEYKEKSETLSSVEKSEMLDGIIQSEYYIETLKNGLTETQMEYYGVLIGTSTSTKFKAMLCVLLAIFVHFMICCLIYIYLIRN